MSRYHFDKYAVFNLDGVNTGDYYALSYHSQLAGGYKNVLLQVCDENEHKVCIYEIGLKKVKYQGKIVETVNWNVRPSRNPVIVPKEMNCWSKSNFWVVSHPDGTLSVPIPDLGNAVVTAYPVIDKSCNDGIHTYYFELEDEIESEDIIQKNNFNIC